MYRITTAALLTFLLAFLLLLSSGQVLSVLLPEEESSAEAALTQFKTRLTSALGHAPLNPEIDTLSIEPEELKECAESESQQCFTPLNQVSRHPPCFVVPIPLYSIYYMENSNTHYENY